MINKKGVESRKLNIGHDIEKARKSISDKIEQRRMVIETTKARQKQAIDKYREIREKITDSCSGNQWFENAAHELNTLYKIQEDIDNDINRQKIISQKTTNELRWTIAPSAFPNRRGKSHPGVHLGPGQLPPSATSKLRDPILDAVNKKFYWDSEGRRHRREHIEEDNSLISQAMEVLYC
jgi:membrane-associated HD superfamily phosphohydrolase